MPGVKNCPGLALNFLQLNWFFQSFCFLTEHNHLSKHTAQRRPFICNVLFHFFVKRVLKSVIDRRSLHQKEAHLQLVMWYFLLRFKHIWFIDSISFVILVITLVCKEYSCLLSVGSSLVPVDSFSFMNRHFTRPGPWFQCKLNIDLVNNVEARVVWSMKPYLTLTSWERKNKQVWMDIQTDRYLLFLSQRGQYVQSLVC